MLNPSRSQEAVNPQSAIGNPQSEDRVVEVDRFTIDAAFVGKSLVYRTGQLQYLTDFYNEFLVLPAVMITEETRNWLAQSGLFARVTGPAPRTTPTHLLEGNIVELYGDLRDKNDPKAVMQIRVFVSRFDAEGRPAFLYGKDYSATSPVESHDPAGLVDALSRCFRTILTDLQKDLAEKL